jgi:putative membrane protein
MQNRSFTLLACGAGLMLTCSLAQAAIATVSKADKDFLSSAATMDMTGAHAGQMAANQASASEVKDFARMLVQDHSDAFGHLAEVAAKVGVQIPRGINSSRIPSLEGLAPLKGTRFDRQFARDEVTAETRELAAFRHEAKYGQNTDVKQYATKIIPVIENDLKRAQQCATSATKKPNTN